MTLELIIEKTLQTFQKLPNDKALEVSDFADFILNRYEEQFLQNGIQKIVSDSDVFNFLNEDEDLYSVADVKGKL